MTQSDGDGIQSLDLKMETLLGKKILKSSQQSFVTDYFQQFSLYIHGKCSHWDYVTMARDMVLFKERGMFFPASQVHQFEPCKTKESEPTHLVKDKPIRIINY